jgi:hypothetical protein
MHQASQEDLDAAKKAAEAVIPEGTILSGYLVVAKYLNPDGPQSWCIVADDYSPVTDMIGVLEEVKWDMIRSDFLEEGE